MREITFEELKAIEKDVLFQFNDYCCANSLRYSLGGGTLLGAVRHGGFIPWDDDVDVMMPRPDYDLFLTICKEKEPPFDVISHESDYDYYHLFSKAQARHTFTDNGSNNKRYGISIDVFPIDGLGEDQHAAVKNFNRSSFLRELLIAKKWARYSRSKTHSIIYEPIRLGLFIISRFVSADRLITKIEKIMRSIDFETSEYAGCVCGSYRTAEIVPADNFKHYTEIMFEGKPLQCIRDYEQYLRQHYGDYMKLPPKEKQVTHHNFKAYVLEKEDLEV